MRKIWSFLRSFNTGDWMASVIVISLSAWVLWTIAGNMWNFTVASLQPALPEAILRAETRYDLVAQRSMAAAAWWMVIITGISALVGSAGLLLIALTLREARRSANAADKAVEASQAAIDTTREMGQAQVRAYVMVADAELGWDGNGQYALTVEIVNSGQTPAFRVWVEATFYVADDAGEEQFVEEVDVSLHDMPAQSEADAVLISDKLDAALEAANSLDVTFVTVSISICYDTVFEEGEEVEAAYYGTEETRRSNIELTRDMSGDDDDTYVEHDLGQDIEEL